ncbi:uncharacterized protein LOC115671784 [Syzygium oleosum]|uniref:uncharacterized protein LOC115671784 n=1 Tax=Syzygium oleosum TaxID=219896 RepID=UPI0011D1AA70|nr:uncharacterized protein LOC115671784 [Syzygium oleosum]
MMACRTALRCALLTEPWKPSLATPASFSLSLSLASAASSPPPPPRRLGCGHRPPWAPDSHAARRGRELNCSTGNGSWSPPENSEEYDQEEQGPPQEAVLKAISEVSKAEGRVGQTTNVVIGGTVSDDSTNEWLALDKKVNTYPTVRGFTAIGTGGDDFVQAMIVAVESVIQQPIPKGRVRQKSSSRGKYVSVNIGPIHVVSSEQVQAVYNAMRRDERMKYFL